MDGPQFDQIVRTLAARSSRRTLAGLTSSLLAALPWAMGLADASAKKKRKKKKKKKRPANVSPPPPPPPGCATRCAASKPCGPNGCGGSCGSCAGNDVCQNGTCVCVPQCRGKICGDDGCGGSCGTCIGGTCDAGICACPGVQEFCGGACVPGCGTQPLLTRNPVTCDCCLVSFAECSATIFECCSGTCKEIGAGDPLMCAGRSAGDGCDFDAQCVSNNCRDFGPQVGTCA